MDLWNKLLKEYDEIVYIPMSSGLSASCATALALAADFEGSVFVVDNKRISITQYQSVLDARALAEMCIRDSLYTGLWCNQKYQSLVFSRSG